MPVKTCTLARSAAAAAAGRTGVAAGFTLEICRTVHTHDVQFVLVRIYGGIAPDNFNVTILRHQQPRREAAQRLFLFSSFSPMVLPGGQKERKKRNKE